MKRTVLLFLAALLGSSAQAQWNLLGRNEDLRIYVDQAAIQKSGDIARMWHLYDYTSAQWVATQQVVLSVRHLVEYDCAGMRARIIAGAAYSEQMGSGRLVSSENMPDAAWSPIPPGGTAENTWKIACGKNS